MSLLCSTRSANLLFSSLAVIFLFAQLPSGRVAAQSHTASPAITPADAATLRRALAAYDQGNTSQAEPALRELARKYPGNYQANEALGSLYAEAGRLADALPYLTHAVDTEPRQAIAHANLGAAYLKLNRNPEGLQKALKELQIAARLDPKNAATQSNLAQALMAAGEKREAAQAFSLAAAQDPANPDLLYNWALALFDSGQISDAAAVLARLPQSASTDQTESLDADVNEKLGRYQEAAVHYERAAQLNPSEPNLYALCLELLKHWTWNAAIKMSDYAVAKYPASTRLQLAAGIARYGSNQYPEAAMAFSRLLAKDPENSLYADLLGRSCSLIAEGETSGCEGLQAFAQTHPANAQAAVYAAANILHRPATEQDTATAEKLLHQAIAADANLPDAYYQLAVLRQQQTQWAESTQLLQHALALRPTFAEAHYRLARAYSHLGRGPDAQKEIALQQQYSQQEKDSVNAKLKEVTTFLVAQQ